MVCFLDIVIRTSEVKGYHYSLYVYISGVHILTSDVAC